MRATQVSNSSRSVVASDKSQFSTSQVTVKKLRRKKIQWPGTGHSQTRRKSSPAIPMFIGPCENKQFGTAEHNPMENNYHPNLIHARTDSPDTQQIVQN